MYEVSQAYNGRTSHVSNYFYCHGQAEKMLYDAEHDLLATAEYHVVSTVNIK